jgi:DNA-binding response OmpR family regulator
MSTPLIAVVDTEPLLVSLMDVLLTDAGYRILPCPEESRAALDYIRDEQPDVVILETWLEHAGAGWNLLEDILVDPATQHIPVIVTTGDVDIVRDEARLLGTVAHSTLVKPFKMDRLLSAIEQALPQRMRTTPASARGSDMS